MAIVQIDRLVPGFESDAVVADNEDASKRAIDYLIDCGHTRIGMLTGPTDVSTAEGRVRGYKRALSERGIPFRAELVRAGSFLRDNAVQEALKLIDAEERPTALFAANNILTEACVLALAERNVRVPSEMSLLGFDDTPWMGLVSPPITTVRQPIAEMATAAAAMLLQRLEDRDLPPRTMVFEGELVLRASVRTIG
jgi:DNA-binding LacI/PurR family transcriptional regulator